MGCNSVADVIVYLHSFSRCCLPQSRNHAKLRQNLTLQQLMVIQGSMVIDLGVNRKHATSY